MGEEDNERKQAQPGARGESAEERPHTARARGL